LMTWWWLVDWWAKIPTNKTNNPPQQHHWTLHLTTATFIYTNNPQSTNQPNNSQPHPTNQPTTHGTDTSLPLLPPSASICLPSYSVGCRGETTPGGAKSQWGGADYTRARIARYHWLIDDINWWIDWLVDAGARIQLTKHQPKPTNQPTNHTKLPTLLPWTADPSCFVHSDVWPN
jgi:hypothetical protein